MYYFEFLRVRSALRTYALWLVALTVLVAATLPFSHAGGHDFTIGVSSETLASGHVSGLAMLHELGERMSIPFGFLCTIAAVLAIVFATGRATSLSYGNRNLHFSFTKPISRERAALTTFAFDAAGIVVAFAIALVLLLVPVAETNLLGRMTFGPSAFEPVLFGLGIAYMWYGLVQGATSTMRSGGVVSGLSWGVFVLVASLQGISSGFLPDAFVTFVHVLGKLDPFEYLKTMLGDFNGMAASASLLDPGYVQNVASVFVVAIVGCAIAIGLRHRMEV